MSARVPKTSPPSAAPPAVAPVPLAPQQAQATARSTAPAGPGGKPKGKDFSAMASRMGGPPPSAQAAPVHAAQAARAAQMQAAARAAAGLPPLERPTATSVTTTPPTIPPPNLAAPPPQRSNSGGNNYQQPKPIAYVPEPSRPMAPIQVKPKPKAVPKAIPKAVPKSTPSIPPPKQVSRTSSSTGGGRRPSHSKSPGVSVTATPPPPKTIKPKEPAKPTPTPVAIESRVSGQTSSAPAAPHMAPLAGPRIQDLVKSMDPNYSLDAAAEHQILQLTDDFLDKVCKQGLRLAQHRNSKTLDVQDLQMVLAKQWNIVIPGLGPPLAKKPKVTAQTAKRKPSLDSSSGPARKLAKS